MSIGRFLIFAIILLTYLGIISLLMIRLIHTGVDYLRTTAERKGRLVGQEVVTVREAYLRHRTPPESM